MSVEPETSLIQARALCIRHRRSGRRVVDHIDIDLAAGQFGVVSGRSGVGKSLVFRALLGLLDSAEWRVSGEVRLLGETVLDRSGYQRATLGQLLGRRVMAIFQDPGAHLHPSLSVGWQIKEMWAPDSWSVGPVLRERSRRLLAEVALGEADHVDRFAFQLSQGQQQRVLIAMALCRAELVLADEPTSSLDERSERQIVRLFLELRDQGRLRSMLAITHNLDAFRPFLRDDDWVLEIRQAAGGACAPRRVADVPPYVTSPPAELQPESGEPPLLEVQDLCLDAPASLWRRPRAVVEGLSCTVRRGEAFSITGPSGIGKTTLAKALVGLVRPRRGRILLRTGPGPADVADLSRPGAWTPELRRAVQIVFQDALGTFNPAMSVGETLRETLRYAGVADAAEQTRRIAALLERLDLLAQGGDAEELLARLPAAFSGGQRQRLGVIRALLVSPALLVADEPFASQDIETALSMVELFRRLRDEDGLTLLLISHDRRLVSLLCRSGVQLGEDPGLPEELPPAPSPSVPNTGAEPDMAVDKP